jgi:type IV secretory pathway VirJ component
VEGIASGLAARGFLVAGVDSREWLAVLRQSPSACISPGGELADLGHYVQEHYRVSSAAPVLVGHSAGATLAYVAVAGGRPGQFAGLLTLSFCADLDLTRPVCRAAAFRATPRADGVRLTPAGALPAPWIALHGLEDRECPASKGRDFAHGVPGRRFVPLPGVTHAYRDAGRWGGFPLFL